jgi:hypothetical protein
MNYREMAVEAVKLAGQELIDRADELICKTEGVKDIDIWIRIPSMTDDPNVIPEMEVSTNVYPRRESLKKIFEMKEKKDD